MSAPSPLLPSPRRDNDANSLSLSLSLSLSFSPTHTLTHTFSITAALYLQEFVPEGTDWAHIDMAGPVWDEKEGGATGFGVGTLAQYAVSRSS